MFRRCTCQCSLLCKLSATQQDKAPRLQQPGTFHRWEAAELIPYLVNSCLHCHLLCLCDVEGVCEPAGCRVQCCHSGSFLRTVEIRISRLQPGQRRNDMRDASYGSMYVQMLGWAPRCGATGVQNATPLLQRALLHTGSASCTAEQPAAATSISEPEQKPRGGVSAPSDLH